MHFVWDKIFLLLQSLSASVSSLLPCITPVHWCHLLCWASAVVFGKILHFSGDGGTADSLRLSFSPWSCNSLIPQSGDASSQLLLCSSFHWPISHNACLKWICSNIILGEAVFLVKWAPVRCHWAVPAHFSPLFLDTTRHKNPPNLQKYFAQKSDIKRRIELIYWSWSNSLNGVIFIHIELNIISVSLLGKLHG